MATRADCPKCRLKLSKVTDHCPTIPTRSCWWIAHACGAVIDARHPDRWLDYPISTQGDPHD